MATVSFNDNDTEVQIAAQAAGQGAPANAPITVRPPQPVSPRSYVEDEDVTGEFGTDDMAMPRINVVQRVGDLADHFPPGTILLNKEIVLGDSANPVEVVALRIKKQYQEMVPFGSDAEARVFDTAAEVVANGGQVSNYDGPHYFGPLATILFLVKMPKSVAPHLSAFFPYKCGEDNYAIAVFTAARSAYTGVAFKLVEQKRATGSVRGVLWKFQSVLTKRNSNTWFKPTLAPLGVPSDDFANYIATLPL